MTRCRSLSSVVLVAATVAASGCLYVPAEQGAAPTLFGAPQPRAAPPSTTFDKAPEGKVSVEQLGEMVQGFADSFYSLLSSAIDQLVAAARTPEERLQLERFQSRTIIAIYDIATNPDPFSQLLDLTVVVTLTATIAIDEAKADDLLGTPERAQILKTPLRKAREDVWEIASRVLTPEQLETLDRLIFDWRRDNPDVESISFVRFGDFATGRGKSVIADVRSGTGLLAPVDDAKKELNETRLLGERIFYMAKRAPLLISMQSDQLLSQVATTPEVKQAIDVAERLATSVDRVSLVAEKLPATLIAERENIVASIEQTSGTLRLTLADYESAIGRTDDLVHSVNDLSVSAREVLRSVDGAAGTLTKTLEAAERVAKQFAPAPGSETAKPVDPEVYARMVADVKGSLVELNKALESTRTLAEGSLWAKPLEAADRISKARVEHASSELRGLVDVIFLRGIVLIGLTFSLLFLYKAWSVYLRRSANRRDNRQTDSHLHQEIAP
ncbi:MAG: hypothetical protein SGJ09_17015 [Phycisphaerae bacterium]|nr:hypothetical protein [Phycisphaerae bacterium]